METAAHRRLSILFVTPVSPFMRASGSEQRSALMMEALSELGRVDVVQLTPGEKTTVDRSDNGDVCQVVAVLSGADKAIGRYRPKRDFTQSLERALGHRIGEYDLVVGRYLWPLCQIVRPPNTPAVADLDDFRFRYSPLLPWSFEVFRHALSKRLARSMARLQLNRFNGFFVTSARDHRELSTLAARPATHLPNVPCSGCVETAELSPGATVLFVGSLWYQPNIDGVNWFLRHVWPLVLASCPSASLVLAGAAPPKRREGWEKHPRVSAPGFVADINLLYSEARAVVVPVLSGGGTNIKVLEAMARGKPCIVTQFTADAFEDAFKNGKHFIASGSAAEFARAVIRVVTGDEDAVKHLADEGRRLVAGRFTPQAFQSSVKTFAEEILSRNRL